MRPIISYYGGKQRIASQIVEIINTIPHTVYVEPFFGGGAVFFARQVPSVTNGDHFREVINDRSKALINLYQVIREQTEEFERWVQFTLYSQEEYRRAIAVCEAPETVTEIEWAHAYYININMSFSNKLNAGWGTGVTSRNHAATWHSRKRHLPESMARLANVYISCEDALEVILRWDSPQTLHYLDPPYPGANQGHYGGYSHEDHERMCSLLDNIQGSYILSNYECGVEPQSAQKIINIEAICSASGTGRVKGDRSRKATQEELGDRTRIEKLWVCDRSHGSRKELQRLMSGTQMSLL